MAPLPPHALPDFVDRNLVASGPCYFHCREETSFRRREAGGREVGLYHCPAGYVSRVVYYDRDPDRDWFLSWLRSRVAPLEVPAREVRVATRHPWEFGEAGRPRGGLEPYLLRQFYWTQPRPQGRGAERLYVCVGTPETAGCGTLFVQTVGDERPLCPDCLSRRRW